MLYQPITTQEEAERCVLFGLPLCYFTVDERYEGALHRQPNRRVLEVAVEYMDAVLRLDQMFHTDRLFIYLGDPE